MSGVYTVSQLKKVLSPVFDTCGIRKAVLFGSYGEDTATEKSDIDLLDITHITAGSHIDREIQQTGMMVYEK